MAKTGKIHFSSSVFKLINTNPSPKQLIPPPQKPSHVLKAMKINNDDINSHLRFSFGWSTKIGDGLNAANIVLSTVEDII